MKKICHTRLLKTCGLSRMSVILNFPQSVNPKVDVRKWPQGEFSLEVAPEGDQFALNLITSGKTEALGVFKDEQAARQALDALYAQMTHQKVRFVFKAFGYLAMGLVLWASALFAYGVFVTFGPSAAYSARAAMTPAETNASASVSQPQFPFPVQEQTEATTPAPAQNSGDPMAQLTERALADVQRQALIEQEKIAEQVKTQGQTQAPAVTSSNDVNDAFAAAKK
jgi:hypothetical protein